MSFQKIFLNMRIQPSPSLQPLQDRRSGTQHTPCPWNEKVADGTCIRRTKKKGDTKTYFSTHGNETKGNPFFCLHFVQMLSRVLKLESSLAPTWVAATRTETASSTAILVPSFQFARNLCQQQLPLLFFRQACWCSRCFVASLFPRSCWRTFEYLRRGLRVRSALRFRFGRSRSFHAWLFLNLRITVLRFGT